MGKTHHENTKKILEETINDEKNAQLDLNIIQEELKLQLQKSKQNQ